MAWFSSALNSVVEAVVILFVGLIIGRVVGRLLRKLIGEAEIHRFSRKTGIRLTLAQYIDIIAEYLIYFVALMAALDRIGMATIFAYGILIAIVVLVILTLTFGAKDIFPNICAGISLLRHRQFCAGDYISVGVVSGKVVKQGILETTILTEKNEEIRLPNSLIASARISVKNPRRPQGR